ncbi:MAG: DMT family transporter [Dehalococcoidia bacterium]|nr:DMT family transporter [Dehalococcoidia bacterium]
MGISRWFSLPTFAAVVIWGVVPTATKFALVDFHPLGLVLLRLVITSVLFFLLLMKVEKDWRVKKEDLPLLCLAGVVGAGVFQVLFTIGVNNTTAANTGIIMALAPIFTTLLAAATGQEKLRSLSLLGILVAFGGVFVLVEGKGLSHWTEGLLGDVIVIGAAFAWALYPLAAAPLLKKYSVLKTTTYATILAAVALLPFTVGTLAQQDWSNISFGGWMGGGYFVIFGGLVAWWLWGLGIRRLVPTQTMVYYYFQPLVGVAAAILLLAEQLNPVQWGGIVAIFVGVGVARKW